MKVTAVETTILADRYILVKVLTDEGITGWGECSPMGAGPIKAMVDETLASLVIGRDPFDTESIWREMLLRRYKLGPMGVQLIGMAGLDIALWDIKGKALGAPIYTLLGGALRERIRMYASFRCERISVRETVERVLGYMKDGFTAVKIRGLGQITSEDRADLALERVREVRRAAGDDLLIMADVNNGWSVATAIKGGKQMEEYNVHHIEEPVAAYDYKGLAAVARALDVPVAAGEHEFTRWQFRDLIEIAQVDIIQPDVVKSGGISETWNIATLGTVFGKPCTVHNTQPTIGTAATLHLAAALPNFVYPQEYGVGPHPLREGLMKEPLVLRNGCLAAPTGPGLGIEIDERQLARLAG